VEKRCSPETVGPEAGPQCIGGVWKRAMCMSRGEGMRRKGKRIHWEGNVPGGSRASFSFKRRGKKKKDSRTELGDV